MKRWSTPLDIETIFTQPSFPSYPQRLAGHDGVFYLQAQQAEKGRVALVYQAADADAPEQVLLPEPYQIRSAVHEYGGKCFCLAEGVNNGVGAGQLYFNDYQTGQIFAFSLDGQQAAQPISAKTELGCQFADLVIHQQAALLVAVREQSMPEAEENRNSLVAFGLNQPEPQAAVELLSGAGFYANPVISLDGSKIAWFEWNHPHMPWDQSCLKVATLEYIDGQISGLTQIQPLVDTPHTAICQLAWLWDGSLVFAMDQSEVRLEGQLDQAANNNGFWNLYRWHQGKITALTDEAAEYGEAHWVFGQSRWLQVADDALLAVRTKGDEDALVKIFLDGRAPQVLADGYSGCSQLSLSKPQADEVLCITNKAAAPAQVLSINAMTAEQQMIYSLPELLAKADTSTPQSIAYPTRDGQQAQAFYFPPKNSQYCYEDKQTPPLIVMVHGGPTSRARADLALLKQYFTTSGFAVLDVNHRGSTGYGRAYRQALLGRWGEIDANDIADGIKWLVEQGLADEKAVFIRGGSAGGYAVLRALTRFPELFSGGACYYGIGNLITLSEITHKFESHYTDQLIGEVFDPLSAREDSSEYVKRSPIFAMDAVKSPVILFQGLDDKVVPPEVSREVVRTLEKNAIAHEYIEYEGEGHGFRQTATRIDAMQREMNFYAAIMDGQLDKQTGAKLKGAKQ